MTTIKHFIQINLSEKEVESENLLLVRPSQWVLSEIGSGLRF